LIRSPPTFFWYAQPRPMIRHTSPPLNSSFWVVEEQFLKPAFLRALRSHPGDGGCNSPTSPLFLPFVLLIPLSSLVTRNWRVLVYWLLPDTECLSVSFPLRSLTFASLGFCGTARSPSPFAPFKSSQDESLTSGDLGMMCFLFLPPSFSCFPSQVQSPSNFFFLDWSRVVTPHPSLSSFAPIDCFLEGPEIYDELFSSLLLEWMEWELALTF